MDARRKKTVALAAALMLLFSAAMPLIAAAGETDPSDAIIAPTTVKPWLKQLAETPAPAAQITAPAATATHPPSLLDYLEESAATATAGPPSLLDELEPSGAAGTRSPSSLSELETEEAQATPTPAPSINTLPDSLGLESATRMRFLLIGTDAYTIRKTGRSDTMILMQLDVETNEVKMVSFLRDLYVAIPGYQKTRLNAAYVYGGASLLKDTLQNNFGVTADRTVAVNFSLMVDMIDLIGGVTVDVSEKERTQLNSILKYYNTQNGFSKNDQLLEQSGEQLLTGKQALCYSRIRKMDSDFQRAGRQRKVLEALYTRARSLDALTLSQLLYRVLPDIWTDMTFADAAALIPVLLNLQDITFSSLTVPINGGYSSQTKSGMSVLVPDLDVNENAIEAFLD